MELYEYMTNDNKRMVMRVLKPEGWSAADQRTCILFYFGGGFLKRFIEHFQRQAEYFTKLGVVCVLADYRLASEGSGLETCWKDAEAVLKHIYEQSELGIDKDKIIVCGGSAGGALACWCSMSTDIPCAQVLFNPVLFMGDEKIEIITPQEVVVQVNNETTNVNKVKQYEAFWGERYKNEPKRFSAYHMLDTCTIPSTLILQGTYDPITYQGVILFHQKAIEKKQECYTILYQGESHGFFNYDKIDNKFCYYDTLHQMEKFLKERKLI